MVVNEQEDILQWDNMTQNVGQIAPERSYNWFEGHRQSV
jgi:hypothetical protein